jgi:hypothetical protein
MLITKEITIKINNRYIDFYKSKGYDVKGGTFHKIKIEDLSLSSHYLVKVKCDKCGDEKEIKYYNYITNIEKNKIYICNKCKGEIIKNSNLLKYGVKSTLELDSVKEKCKKTMIEKYGVEHFSKSDDFKNLSIKKYGVKSTLELDWVKEKCKKTMIEKYGVYHYSKCKNFIKKVNDKCNEKYGVEHYSKTSKFKEQIRLSVLNRIINKNDFEILNYENNFITAKCEKNHEYVIHRHILKNRIKYNTEICTICNPIGSFSSSGYETQFESLIQENYKGNIISNDRTILKPRELDIYLPDLKLAFEFNGLWWHNELNKENDYHLNKTEKCEKNNIQLIQIWEDDWIYKQEIVKSMILNKLGKTPNKIYARNCEIKEINNSNLIKDFLNKNHLQGFIGSKIKIGLFYKNELISLITFGNLRIAMGEKSTKEGEYELLRFCNKLNINVIGGASKLFNYFIETYKPKEITTYADRSFSQGDLYKQLGFEFKGNTEPNYYYIIDGIRHHRFNFRKDKLVKEGYDKNKTEHKIMIERKIYRIYDSGNLKFIYNKNN